MIIFFSWYELFWKHITKSYNEICNEYLIKSWGQKLPQHLLFSKLLFALWENLFTLWEDYLVNNLCWLKFSYKIQYMNWMNVVFKLFEVAFHANFCDKCSRKSKTYFYPFLFLKKKKPCHDVYYDPSHHIFQYYENVRQSERITAFIMIFYLLFVFEQSFKGTLSGLRQFLAIENPLKWWKMLFISPEKLFSFSRYLNFCLDFWVMQQNNLIRKIG